MKVTVNGDGREVPTGITVADLLSEIGTPEERVAVEVNLDVVPRKQYRERTLQEGDTIEVVTFVGGG